MRATPLMLLFLYREVPAANEGRRGRPYGGVLSAEAPE